MEISRDLGGGRTLSVSAPGVGSWCLVLGEDGNEIDSLRITEYTLRQIMRGRTIPGDFEIRGLRHEVEFRIAGMTFAHIKKAELLELLASAAVAEESGPARGVH